MNMDSEKRQPCRKDQLLEAIKAECKLLGERFDSCWIRESASTLERALKSFQARRLRNQEFEATRIQNLINEPIPFVATDLAGWSVFMHTCGGGTRNVRSARGLS